MELSVEKLSELMTSEDVLILDSAVFDWALFEDNVDGVIPQLGEPGECQCASPPSKSPSVDSALVEEGTKIALLAAPSRGFHGGAAYAGNAGDKSLDDIVRG